MDDDFNTGGMIGELFEMLKRLNKFVDENKLEETKDAALAEQLKAGRIDLALLPDFPRAADPAIKSELLYYEEMVLAAREGALPEKALLGPGKVNPAGLRGLPFYLLFPEHISRSFCDGFFKKHRINPRIVTEFSSSISCYRMAATGMGLAIIPFFVTRLANADGPVALYSFGQTPILREINVYYRKDSYIGLPERELIESCKAVFDHEQL